MAWKKWLKRTALAVVVSLLARTAWLVGSREWDRSKGEKELAAAVAETEAADPDWAWEGLAAARRIPPPERNAAALIPKVKALLPPDWVRFDRQTTWEPAYPPQPPNRPLPDETVAAARRELGRAGEAVALARTLEGLPDGNRAIPLAPDVLSTKLQDTQDTRAVAAVLRWDAVLAVADGDRDRAAADLLALLNASRSVGDEPLLVSQLARVAVRATAARSAEWVLGQAELPEPRLAALQAAWAADAEEPLLLYGLRGERAAYDVLLKNLADGTVTPEAVAGRADPGLSFGGYAWWLYRGRFPRERAAYHRYMTRAVAAARLPVHEQLTAVRAFTPPAEDLRFAGLVLPAVEQVALAYRRSVAEARCVAAALACERYRVRAGRWPAGLADLVPDLLGSVPVDPYDGRPLRYRVLADGAVVYSVGRDGADDGGDTTHAGNPAGKDEGVRLWDPVIWRAKPREDGGR